MTSFDKRLRDELDSVMAQVESKVLVLTNVVTAMGSEAGASPPSVFVQKLAAMEEQLSKIQPGNFDKVVVEMMEFKNKLDYLNNTNLKMQTESDRISDVAGRALVAA